MWAAFGARPVAPAQAGKEIRLHRALSAKGGAGQGGGRKSPSPLTGEDTKTWQLAA